MNHKKYRSIKTVIDGITFDSRAEARRYSELKLLQKAGHISNLTLQPEFVLMPSFKRNGKTHRAIIYIADFQYIDLNNDGWITVEDVKGFATAHFKDKMKLFLAGPGKELKYYLIKNGVKHEI